MYSNICVYGLGWWIGTMKIYIATKKSHTILVCHMLYPAIYIYTYSHITICIAIYI